MILVHDDQESDVHSHNDEIDDEEVPHELALASKRCLEYVDRFPDIQPRDYELLDTEKRHLDLLHHLVKRRGLTPIHARRRPRNKQQHRHSRMPRNSIKNNHPKHCALDLDAAEN